MTSKTEPRMTLSLHKVYPLAECRRFLGLGPKTNPSVRNFPFLVNCAGPGRPAHGAPASGYLGESIVETIRNRDGITEVKSEWYDWNADSIRAEIVYC